MIFDGIVKIVKRMLVMKNTTIVVMFIQNNDPQFKIFLVTNFTAHFKHSNIRDIIYENEVATSKFLLSCLNIPCSTHVTKKFLNANRIFSIHNSCLKKNIEMILIY